MIISLPAFINIIHVQYIKHFNFYYIRSTNIYNITYMSISICNFYRWWYYSYNAITIRYV